MAQQEGKYKGLTNEEVLLIYHKMKAYFDEVEQKLAKKIVKAKGKEITVSDTVIEEYKKTPKYTLLKSTLEKLEPIVEFVTEDRELKKLNEILK